MDKKDAKRGRIVAIILKREIKFNGYSISEAVIEIDHINYGMNPKTGKLNTRARTNFTVKDVEKFIVLLDGEDLTPERYEGKRSIFEIRIDCPIQGRFHGKEFTMVFITDYKNNKQIHTITLFPNW